MFKSATLLKPGEACKAIPASIPTHCKAFSVKYNYKPKSGAIGNLQGAYREVIGNFPRSKSIITPHVHRYAIYPAVIVVITSA